MHPLLSQADALHTTALGAIRIQKNLNLGTEDAVQWCKKQLFHPQASIVRKGKNWYISTPSCVITVNAYSNTIITAHKAKHDV